LGDLTNHSWGGIPLGEPGCPYGKGIEVESYKFQSIVRREGVKKKNEEKKNRTGQTVFRLS